MTAELIVTRNFAKPGQAFMEIADRDNAKLEVYLKKGGYEAAKKAVTSMEPQAIIDEVKKSKLRGRGGAGFPTGVKWGFIPKDGKRHYLVINGDEGEPGTFKDRYILEFDPHAIIEGAMIACRAIAADKTYVYIRGEFHAQKAALQNAADEAYAAGLLGKPLWGTGFKMDFTVATGAGAYVCGEETSLIESLEGKRGMPRLKPPFPAVVGLYGAPTIVNNVETIASVPPIISMGGERFASLGSAGSGGTRMFAVSGHVKRPGVYELPMSTSLEDLIYNHAGGPSRVNPLTGNPLGVKAVIPGGSSSPVLLPNQLKCACCYDEIAAEGSMAGSGGVIVIDEGVCMVKSALVLMKFYMNESCGQCTPCREGTRMLYLLTKKFEDGEGTQRDLELLDEISSQMLGTTICALSDAAAMPIRAIIKKFRGEFLAHVGKKVCPYDELERAMFPQWPAAAATPVHEEKPRHFSKAPLG